MSTVAEPAHVDEVGWSNYAQAYDLLVSHNLAYQGLLADFTAFLSDLPQADALTVLDVGAGTGNFSRQVQTVLKDPLLIVNEPDPEMMRRARGKLGPFEARYEQCPLEDLSLGGSAADLIVCCHALFAMPDPVAALRKIRSFCHAETVFYVVDLGKRINILDWKLFFIASIVKKFGVRELIRLRTASSPIEGANKKIRDGQDAGVIWMNTQESFANHLADSGFTVQRSWRTYRGYSNAAICTPTP